eukprot:810278-Alexandrium_andersonii.AAC.1
MIPRSRVASLIIFIVWVPRPLMKFVLGVRAASWLPHRIHRLPGHCACEARASQAVAVVPVLSCLLVV